MTVADQADGGAGKLLRRAKAAATRWRNHIFALGVVLAMLLLGHGVRAPDIAHDVGAQNIETPWHVLLTVEAMAETPATKHAFLPIVTLGRPADLGIPWGGAIPDSEGRRYYTSATTVTFILPYAWFSALGLEPTMANLAGFNFVLQIAALLLLYGFLFRLLSKIGVEEQTAAFSAAGALAIGIFCREALLSFGMIYWFHGFYAVTLASALWLILEAVSSEQAPRPRLIALVSLACFLGAWTDWSGFVFAIGAAAVVLLFDRSRRSLVLAAAILFGAFVAGLAILIHYAAVVDIVQTIGAYQARLGERSAAGGRGLLYNIVSLAQGYVLSFGLFLPIVLAGVVIVLRAKLPPQALKLVLMMTLISAAALGQNAVVLSNVAEFSYERLKAFLPAAVVIALALAVAGPKMRAGLAAALFVASLFGVWSYKEDNSFYARWNAIDGNNLAFRDEIVAAPEHECAVYLTNLATRGYGTLLFRRMMFEPWAYPTPDGGEPVWDFADPASRALIADAARDAVARTGACTAIYIEGRVPNWIPPFTDMPEFATAYIGAEGGAPRVIQADAVPGEDRRSPFVRLLSYGAYGDE